MLLFMQEPYLLLGVLGRLFIRQMSSAPKMSLPCVANLRYNAWFTSLLQVFTRLEKTNSISRKVILQNKTTSTITSEANWPLKNFFLTIQMCQVSSCVQEDYLA